MSIDEEVLESVEDAKKASIMKLYNDGVSLAGAMLAADKTFLLILYPLLVLPSLSTTFLSTLSPEIIIGVSLTERILEIAFFLALCTRWLKAFQLKKYTLPLSGALLISAVSLSAWFILNLPTFASITHAPDVVDYIAVIFFVMLTFATIRLYFYFFPALAGVTGASEIILRSRIFCRDHQSLPMKLLLAPIAISALYSGIITGFSPDIRNVGVSILLDLGAEIYWVIACYLSLGVALSIAARTRDYAPLFEPYITSRFDTMRLLAPRWITSIIHPRNCASLLLVAVLVWTGNIVRQWSLPPTPSILVEQVAYNPDKKSATVKLKAEDEKYNFRGFKPILFHLAGENGDAISASPASAKMLPDNNDVLFTVPRSSTGIVIELELPIIDRADDFTKLKDLHLWYGQVKLVPINTPQ